MITRRIRAVRLVSGSSLAVLASAALLAPAHAQDAPQATAPANANTVEEVVVTGFRASLASALNIKRQTSGVVDVIKAEDIAKFPDANLAESLQRIPGVSLTRGDGGEGKQITVRGLNAGFTRVRINGIEGVTATGSSDINGSTNRGRGFDFSVFASELFNAVEVRKTSSANVEEGSLGATVDLRSGRPFDYRGETLALGAQAFHNSLSEKTQPRFTGLYSNTWGDFGALVSVAYSKRTAVEEGYEAVELLPASADGGFCSPLGYTPQTPANTPAKGTDAANCAFGLPRTSVLSAYNSVFSRTDNFGGTVATPAPGSGAFAPRIPRYRRSSTEYERMGVTGALQWRPSSATELNFDMLLGEFKNTRLDNYIEAISFGRSIAQANGKAHSSILDAHFAPDGSWDYGLFNGVDIRTEGLRDRYTTYFGEYVLSGRHDFNDRFSIDGLIGSSRSDLKNPERTTVQFDAPNVNGYSFDFRGDNNVPTLNHVIDITNPNAFKFAPIGADGTVNGQFVGRYLDTKNKLETAELNAKWKAADFVSIRAGLSQRKNTWNNYEVGFGSNGANPPLPAGVTLADVSRQISGFGKGLGGSGVPSSWAAVDLDKFLGVLDIECNCAAVPGSQYDTLNQVIRGVKEEIFAGYAMADFNFELGSVPIRGDLGVRQVKTKVASTGVVSAGATRNVVTIDNEYSDTLPSMNLAAEIRPNLLLRLSAGKTLSRPEYTDLAPTTTINTQTQNVNIGNPDLDPIRAKTVDLQAEWYFAKDSLISVGYFHKDIDTFIQGVSELTPFNTLGLDPSVLVSGGCSLTAAPQCPTLPTSTVTVNRKVNTPGGPLDGYELNFQSPFSFLPGFWSRFGVLANYTHVKSEITYITRVDNPNTTANELLTQTANFTGLSPDAYNLTLYYEDEKISARVSAAHRSDYLLNVLGDVNGHDVTVVDGSTNIDFSASYNISKQLRLSIEGQNLTDEPLRYGRDSGRDDTLLYVHSGRSFVVGLNYRF
jgi:iron complex outermembrane receptor protein